MVNQSASWFLSAGKIVFFFDIMNAMISLLFLVKFGCFDVERNAFPIVHVQFDGEKTRTRRENDSSYPSRLHLKQHHVMF